MKKLVIFTMGGKGGVGKTAFMVNLAEYFEFHKIPKTLIDCDMRFFAQKNGLFLDSL